MSFSREISISKTRTAQDEQQKNRPNSNYKSFLLQSKKFQDENDENWQEDLK